MFDTKKAIKHSTNPNICDYVFEKYINTIDYTSIKKSNKRYYDHLGVIDTLGWDEGRTINSYSYSCEGGSLHCIYSGSLWFVHVNFDIAEVYIFKENPFPIFRETNKTVAAFETWNNGGIQTSGFYKGPEADKFIERHYKSGTFATLHEFTSVDEAWQEYISYHRLKYPLPKT